MKASVKTVAAKPANKPAAAPAVTHAMPKRRATIVKKGAAAKASPAAPAAKTNTAKPTAAKPVEKTVKAKVEKTARAKKVIVPFVPRALSKGKLPFVIAERARPQSNPGLFAHTHAALTMLGMFADNCPIIPEVSALTVIGQRAVKYHIGKGNFVETKDHGLRLTVAGLNKFKARLAEGKVDGAMANGYMGLFIEGKPGNTGVDPRHIYQAAII
jgi:hypothetical protein